MDGVCDDGGANSLWSACELGEDCTDCGPRSLVNEEICIDDADSTCAFLNDNDCDDGGVGADYW